MDNRTAVTWILTNGCSWTPNSRPREITQNEQRCLSNNQSKLVYSIMYCKSRFFCSFLGVEKGCWFYKSSTMGKPPPPPKNRIRLHFYWSTTIYTPPPLFNQIWIALFQWWSYQCMCSYAERNWVSNWVQYQSKLKEVYLHETENGFSRLLIQR